MLRVALPTLLTLLPAFTQAQLPLQQQIHDLAKEAHGIVSVACSLRGRTWIATSTRMVGLLPAGMIVAYKTGTAGYNNNMAAATNDVALITLPTGGA
jgi:hypothetical protein